MEKNTYNKTSKDMLPGNRRNHDLLKGNCGLKINIFVLIARKQ